MKGVHRRAIKTADEQDVHTPWRRLYTGLQRAGQTRKIKTATNRRERREGQHTTDVETREAVQDMIERGGWYD